MRVQTGSLLVAFLAACALLAIAPSRAERATPPPGSERAASRIGSKVVDMVAAMLLRAAPGAVLMTRPGIPPLLLSVLPAPPVMPRKNRLM